mgnify:CR=1 FL=1
MQEAHWLTVAKTLPAGGKVKVKCCSADNSMLVSNDRRGYRGHCFRCGDSPFVPHGLFSITDLARRKAEQALLAERTVKLPRDFTTDIPPSEAVWLYENGLSADIAEHYGFGYSASLRRVVLPVYQNGSLQGFTARSTINERPKYIEKMASASEGIFLSDPRVILPSYKAWAETDGPDIVFTEDILSAVRAGRIVKRAVSIMGTSVSPEQIHAAAGLPTDSLRIAVWLDPDKAGRRGAFKLVRTLTLMGYDVQTVQSKKDPKKYTYKQIQEYLEC